VSSLASFSLAMLCALEIEADPIIRLLKMHEHQDIFDQRLRLRFFASSRFPDICLVLFGKCPRAKVDRIGTQIATLAAWESIRQIRPAFLASVGTAGGFKAKGAQIGDIYASHGSIYFHGRHIPVPAYRSFELGEFPSSKLDINGTIKKGVISSGDCVPLVASDQEKMQLIGTDAKDMEAAAVAEIANLAGVPMFAVKSISDFVDSDERTHEQFLANYKIATEKLAQAMEFIVSNRCFDLTGR